MLKDILTVLGGSLWLILKFILIIALSMVGVYCFGTMFFYRFIWDGLTRLAIAAGCGLGVYGIIRLSREKDDAPPTEDDFRP